MVQTEELKKRMAASGLKNIFICEQMGISRQALDMKINNKRPFRASEIYVVADLLKLTNDEKQSIFYAENVNQ